MTVTWKIVQICSGKTLSLPSLFLICFLPLCLWGCTQRWRATHSQSMKRIKRASSISCHLDRTNLVEEFLDTRKKIFLTGTLREIPSGLLPQVANQNTRFASFRLLVEDIHNKRSFWPVDWMKFYVWWLSARVFIAARQLWEFHYYYVVNIIKWLYF